MMYFLHFGSWIELTQVGFFEPLKDRGPLNSVTKMVYSGSLKNLFKKMDAVAVSKEIIRYYHGVESGDSIG